MKPLRPVYIVGGGHSPFTGKGHPDFITRRHPDFGQRENPDATTHMQVALAATVDATGLDFETVDKVYVSNFLGECFIKQGHLGALAVAASSSLIALSRCAAASASSAAGSSAAASPTASLSVP